MFCSSEVVAGSGTRLRHRPLADVVPSWSGTIHAFKLQSRVRRLAFDRLVLAQPQSSDGYAVNCGADQCCSGTDAQVVQALVPSMTPGTCCSLVERLESRMDVAEPCTGTGLRPARASTVAFLGVSR